jgi:hypothetical protein
MSPTERRELRFPLLALLLALVTAGGAGYHTDRVLASSRSQLAQHEAQLQDARMRLHRSGDERDVIIHYLARYEALQRLGFAGDEARINWLDGLRLANDRVNLFGVDYQITAQAPYAQAGDLNPGDLVLHQSLMTLRLRLLHEEDLLRFFSALRDAGVGMFAIDECAIKRMDSRGDARYQPNLLAECKLSWLTAKPRRLDNQP